jgi:hypothetical protein
MIEIIKHKKYDGKKIARFTLKNKVVPKVPTRKEVIKIASNKWTEVEKRLDDIELWTIQGLSEKEISAMLGLAYSTFREYKKAYSALSETLAIGKIKRQEANSKVEQALYMKAIGYNYTEEKEIKLKETYYDDEGRACSNERVEVVKLKKHSPADVAAQKFWLTNRNKGEWKDNPHKVENDKKMLELKVKESERNDVF